MRTLCKCVYIYHWKSVNTKQILSRKPGAEPGAEISIKI